MRPWFHLVSRTGERFHSIWWHYNWRKTALWPIGSWIKIASNGGHGCGRKKLGLEALMWLALNFGNYPSFPRLKLIFYECWQKQYKTCTGPKYFARITFLQVSETHMRQDRRISVYNANFRRFKWLFLSKILDHLSRPLRAQWRKQNDWDPQSVTGIVKVINYVQDDRRRP